MLRYLQLCLEEEIEGLEHMGYKRRRGSHLDKPHNMLRECKEELKQQNDANKS